MERQLAPGGLGQRAVELELQDVRQKVARVGRVVRHVILGGRVEELFAAGDRRRDALVFQRADPTTPAL